MKSILITTCITQESDTTISFGDAEPIRLEFKRILEQYIDECNIDTEDEEALSFGENEEWNYNTVAHLGEYSFGLLLFKNVKQHQVIVLDLDYLVEVFAFEVTEPHATKSYLVSEFLPVAAYECQIFNETDDYFYTEVEDTETGTKYLILKIK